MGKNSEPTQSVTEKLQSIYLGWKNLIWKKKEVEIIAKERAAFCSHCDELNIAGFCKDCKCYVSAKIRSLDEECPKGIWRKKNVTNS